MTPRWKTRECGNGGTSERTARNSRASIGSASRPLVRPLFFGGNGMSCIVSTLWRSNERTSENLKLSPLKVDHKTLNSFGIELLAANCITSAITHLRPNWLAAGRKSCQAVTDDTARPIVKVLPRHCYGMVLKTLWVCCLEFIRGGPTGRRSGRPSGNGPPLQTPKKYDRASERSCMSRTDGPRSKEPHFSLSLPPPPLTRLAHSPTFLLEEEGIMIERRRSDAAFVSCNRPRLAKKEKEAECGRI